MNKKVVAAFDFDGTLTKRDILIPFLFRMIGPLKASRALLLTIPALIAFALGKKSRQQVKEKLLEGSIKGLDVASLAILAQSFTEERLPRFIRQEAYERMQWHKAQGHEIAIVSANLAPLLTSFATREGISALISSQLHVDGDGKLTGALEGLNCWGAEKPRRLLALFGSKDSFILYAYGDSRGDKELLDLADYSFYRYFPKEPHKHNAK